MKRIASSTAVASAPTYSADAGTPGHFAESPSPTHLTAKFCEALQEGHVRTIEDGGGTPSDDMAQFSDTVAGVHAIKSGVTTTGTVSTQRLRAVIASQTSAASGADSAVVGSSVSVASGAKSAVVGSGLSIASGAGSAVIGSVAVAALCEASGACSAVIAASGSALASGAYSAVIAAEYATATSAGAVVVGGQSSNATAANAGVFGGFDHDATAARAVCVGGDTNNASAADAATLGGATNDASGSYSVVIGGTNNTASGNKSTVMASDHVTASGTEAVIIASSKDSTDVVNAATGGTLISVYSAHLSANATRSVVLASHNVNMNTSYSVGGGVDATSHLNGTNNDGQTWRIESSDGDIFTDGTAGAGAADFAEMFENETRGEIPAGCLVARTGRHVRLASVGDRVHGVVSAAPAVLGGSPLSWPGRYERDDWGRKIPMDFDGVTIPTPSKDFDRTRGDYVRRTERPEEWTPVALVGQVRVRIGSGARPGGVRVGDFLAPGPDGCAVATASPLGRPVEVMEIVQEYDPAKGYGVALCLVG